MKAFRDFTPKTITEMAIVSTPRKGLMHMQNMKPQDFIDLMLDFNDKFKGVLKTEELSVNEKIDGASLRMGQDENGRTFIETGRSGPMFDKGGFSKFSASRGYEPSQLSKSFDELLDKIQSDAKLNKVLSDFNNGNGIKIVGELMYMPLGLDLGDTVKFVKIEYDKRNLGSEWTIVPREVLDGQGNVHPMEEKVLRTLFSISTNERKYIPTAVNIDREIDLTVELGELMKLIDSYEDIETLLASRKKVDAETKELVKRLVAEIQEKVSRKIIASVHSGVLGKNFEGIVLNLDNGKSVKIVSDFFKVSDKHSVVPVSESVVLNEGGNAVEGVVRITQENVPETLAQVYKKLLPLLKIKKSDTRTLGSTGKKKPGDTSGDIDMAISIRALMDTGLETSDDIFDAFVNAAEKLKVPYRDMRSIGIVSIGWPISNVDGKQANQLVQLDLMAVKNLQYAEWSYYSPHWQESEFKGLYRNDLLRAIAKHARMVPTKIGKTKEGEEVPAEWQRYILDVGKGLQFATQSAMGKKGFVTKAHTTVKKEPVSDDPDEIIQILFGEGYKASDFLTFEVLYDFVMSDKFPYKASRKEILQSAAEAMRKNGAPIPERMAKEVKL